ncbi:MAG: response regulator, partial [Candidatus Eisenbacteria bacterium]|nr:response regulator [Candidatus Eisenbacteria bacterium]
MSTRDILVVEDDEDILELVRINLEKEGYTVKAATTGEEALESVGKSIPGL